MNSGESEQLIKNLCIRNQYKDQVLENRCHELRAAHETLWKLKRQCRYLTDMLDKKEKDYSGVTANMERSKEVSVVYCPDLLAGSQNNCDRRLLTYSDIRKQQEELQIHVLPVANTSANSNVSKSISDCLLTEGECLKVTSQTSVLLNDASKTSNGLQNLTEKQRQDLELDVMAFEKEELQMELACVLQEKAHASEDCEVLRTQLEVANQHIAELQKQVAQRSCDVEMVAERLSHCEQQLKRYSQMVNDLEKMVQSKELARNESDSKIEELEELLMVLQSEKTEEAERMCLEVTDITRHDSVFRAVVQEKENMIDHLICEKDELDDRLASQKNLVVSLQGRISELEEMVQQSNERLQGSKAVEWSKERKDLIEQVEILGGQLAQLQSELSGSQQSDGLQSQQMSQLFTLQVENLTLQTEKEDLENRLRQSKEESVYLKECCKELEIQLKCVEGNAGKSQELLKQKKQFVYEKSQLLHSIKNIQMELKEQQVLRTKSEDQLKLLESQNAELLAQLLVLEDKNTEAVGQLRHQLGVANREIESLSYTVAELSGYLKDLKAQNQKLQLESLQITEALGRTEEEFRKARSQDVERISLLQTELERGLEERKNLQIELKSAKVKLSILENELETTFAKNVKLENQLTNEKKELGEKRKLNLRLESEIKRLLSDIQLLQSTTVVKSTPVECDLVEDFTTPSQKRLKICQSSKRKQLSTTQLLQTPTSTQKLHQSAPLRTLQQENVNACIVVPESPLADRCLEPFNYRQAETPGKLISDNFTGLNVM